MSLIFDIETIFLYPFAVSINSLGWFAVIEAFIFVALLLFVGIPLPGTGAWTGTLAASFLKMDFKSSVLAAMCGVLLAGVIMMTLSAGFFSLIQ